MKKYSIWHIPFMSFYSSDLYRDIGLNWKGICFGYLFLILAVCLLPDKVQLQIGISSFIQNDAPGIVSQIPEITIAAGVASFAAPQPHTITAPKTGKVLAILDSTGKYTSLDKTDALALITKNNVIFRTKDKAGVDEVKTYSFEDINEFKMDRQRINDWIDMAGKYLVPAYYALMLLVSFLLKITQLLIFGAIGLFIASWVKINLRYAAALRLSAAAVTPSLIIETVSNLFRIPIPLGDTLSILLAMYYLYFGIKAVSQPDNPQSATQPGR
jgi:hypothetical protein